MPAPSRSRAFTTGTQVGWEAALLEIEHQAEHWETPDHGQVGYLIAQALRAAVGIARTGGLHCEHRDGAAGAPPTVRQLTEGALAVAPPTTPDAERPSSAV